MEGATEGQGERKKFFVKVNVSGFIMFALLWLQALPLFLIDDVRQFLRQKDFITYIALIAICILIVVHVLLIYFKKAKLIWQLIFYILMIEAGALFWGTTCASVESKTVGISLGISIASCLAVIFLAFLLPMSITWRNAFTYAYLGVLILLLLFVILSSRFFGNKTFLLVAGAIITAATTLYLFVITNTIANTGSDSPIFKKIGESDSVPTEHCLYGGFGILVMLLAMFACVLALYYVALNY